MIVLIQLLLLCSLVVFAVVPVLFAAAACDYLITRRSGRHFVITGAFLAGAITAGVVVWQLVPSEWTLPFWTTLQATVDSKTYGHAVEHYAEGIMLAITFAAMLSGSVCAGAAALTARRMSRRAA